LEQLRYIFSHVRGRVPASGLYLRAVQLMTRCYRDLGDAETAAQYATRIERALSNGHLALRAPAESKNGRKVAPRPNAPALSVIIPTCNRQRVLAECLDALGRQTMPPEMFEVIVVDDGSTDETEQFCRYFQPNYSFQYLRQLNAGAGAARRRGGAECSTHAGNISRCLTTIRLPRRTCSPSIGRRNRAAPTEDNACWEIFSFLRRRRIER